MKWNNWCLSVLAAIALVAEVQANAGWTDAAQVLELTPSTQKRFVVRLALDKNNCKSKDSFYMDYSSSGSELIYHTLLEALLANKSVELYANGVCELNGYEGFSAVRLKP